MAVGVAAMSGLDHHIAEHTANNAIDHNFKKLIGSALMVGLPLLTAYDTYSVYETELTATGDQNKAALAAFRNLGLDVALMMVGAKAADGTIKGIKFMAKTPAGQLLADKLNKHVFSSLSQAWNHHLTHTPTLQQAKTLYTSSHQFICKNLDRINKVLGKEAGKVEKELIQSNPQNRLLHEAQKVEYRQQMGRPHAQDEKLNKILEKLHRAEVDCVGSGSTAAAIRYERATGQLVKDKKHINKGLEGIEKLEKWLRNNQTPQVTNNDIAAAQNVLKDLKDALGK